MKGLLLALSLAPFFIAALSNPTGIKAAIYHDFNDVRSPVGVCPSRDTNETVYLIDSANCSIYYVCSNGVAYLKECPTDMYYDPEIQICNWEIDVICVDGNRTVVENLIEVSASRDIFGNLQFVDVPAPLTAVGSCPPRDTNETVYLKDDKNCSIYYICSNGRPIQASCPPDMSFNPEINICDWEVDVGCLGAHERLPRKPVGNCPAIDPPMPVYLPDDTDCKYYYECSGGIPVLNVCPPDLEFNPIKDVCDFPLDSGCKGTGSTETPPAGSTDNPTWETTWTDESTTGGPLDDGSSSLPTF